MNARKFIGVLSVMALLLGAMVLPAIAGDADVVYSGQGLNEDGLVESLKCDPPELGQDSEFVVGEDGFYLKWILAGARAGKDSTITGVTLSGPWGEFEMIQAGRGAWHKATDLYDAEDLIGVVTATIHVDGELARNANPQLTISNGCDSAKVTIVKETVDNRPGSFNFVTEGIGEDFTLVNGESKTFHLPVGRYAVTEEVPENWTLEGIVCEPADSTNVRTTIREPGVGFGVLGYDHVTCTFTNEEATGAVEIVKTYTVDPGTDRATFELFKADADGQAIEGTGVNVPTVEGEDDIYCLDELSFGDYIIKENIPDGFLEDENFDGLVIIDEAGTCDEPTESVTIDNAASPVDLDVFKYKLSYDETAYEGAGGFVASETLLDGFEFTLTQLSGPGGDPAAESEVLTTVDGVASFESLPVGETFRVCETDKATPRAYWSAPYAATGVGAEVALLDGGCQEFTTVLGEDGTLSFYNAPRADLIVRHRDATGYTSMIVECKDSEENVVLEGTLTETDQLRVNQLDMGDYTCSIKIRNGENG